MLHVLFLKTAAKQMINPRFYCTQREKNK